MTKSLDSEIDDLYKRPPEEFTQARKELASTLKGDEARMVKQLKKPTAVPWAVNQVYWHGRAEFDRLLDAGEALRKAQLAALRGKSADVKSAAASHRDAVSAAVAKAADLAAAAGLNPTRDALARTFEALSLAPEPPEPFGKLTQPLQPGGFEMLTGVQPSGKPLTLVRSKPGRSDRAGSVRPPPSRAGSDRAGSVRLQPDPEGAKREQEAQKQAERERREAERAAREREREREAAARRRDAAVKKAEAALAQAREREDQAERAWREAPQAVTRAAQDLRKARSDT